MFDGFGVKHQIRTGSSSNVVCGKRCMFLACPWNFQICDADYDNDDVDVAGDDFDDDV